MSDFSQLRTLAADLGKASADVTRKAQQVVTATAHNIERTAKSRAPVDTGALRNSIGVTISGGGLQATIGPTVNYAAFLEFGTRRMAPRPYMRPAIDAHEPPFVAAIEALGGTIL